MIIAVDGPAASGKGTIARAIARHYGLPHLDTGLLYRAVGWGVMQAGGDGSDLDQALSACAFGPELLDEPGLREEATGAMASKVSAYPAVRAALHAMQLDFARQPSGAVLDGRDIGTVIAPDADAKLFVTASVDERARRRFLEMQGKGVAADLEALAADIRARDDRDMNRAAAPLRQPEGADLLDTSNLTIDAAVQRAIALVDAQLARRR
ncbi:MAG: d(CMP) kinase [Sphingobium sp.]|nr:d(CMP) kinase [Sphingobium sp.]